MSIDGRLGDLERWMGQEGHPAAAVILYDPTQVPKDPTQRDEWFRSLRPSDCRTVFFVPDNGRGRPLGIEP